jgi:hypothetical protein
MQRETSAASKMRSVLEMSLEARFLHPKREISASKIAEIAATLEESCRLASRNRGEEVYLGMVAKMVAHIAPYFFSARHSMVFRDLLLEDRLKDNTGMISDPINVALNMNKFLWPEIFDNPYTTPQEESLILDTRTVEVSIALVMLRMQIKGIASELHLGVSEGTKESITVDRHGKESFSPSTTPQGFIPRRNLAPKLTLSDLVDKAKTKVCFSKSTEAWNQVEPTINITCGRNDATCGLYASSTCLPYEDFLVLFAENNMSGNVLNPFDSEGVEILDPKTTVRIRRVWSKEIKMARVYLDSLGAK